jgi:choline dehydrogenase-like flavoprotein
MALKAERTSFTLDVLGRYACNTWQEAKDSWDQTLRADARQFDVVVVGGGTFGAAVAQHIFAIDATHSHRILVLEAGPYLLPEHNQNLPMIGLDPASPTSIAALRAAGVDGQPRNEVWGLAWHSPVPFPGLAYCVGGRSLYWGGWSPQLLDEEMPTGGTSGATWPASVVTDLTAAGGYFAQSNAQIGADDSNYYIFGSLQTALRNLLAAGLAAGKVSDAVGLPSLPDHPAVAALKTPTTVAKLEDMLGLDKPSGLSVADLRNLMKLEAPLAVQVRTRSGLFPVNKFSSVPVLIKATRAAENESPQDDVKKRLMVVANCHVTGLRFDGQRVYQVATNCGAVPIPPNGVVVLAAATIESTRIALNSFHGTPHYGEIGRNLVAHLRSNLNVRIPVGNIPGVRGNLEQAALFIKGRHTFADGSTRHYHLQITAAGGSKASTDAEAELFKKIPDLDQFEVLRQASAEDVVIVIRAIGEMETLNPKSFVRLDPELDEYNVQRAYVAIEASPRDFELWDAMDKASDDVALLFAGGRDYEVLAHGTSMNVKGGDRAVTILPFAPPRRDSLGSTHHEAGTLRMGDDPANAVTNADGRFHEVDNAYVVGPASLPRTGSPNPMLSGIALARRLGDKLTTQALFTAEKGFTALFDGADMSRWQMAGPGRFIIVDGTLEAVPDPSGLGLLWHTVPAPPDFVLKLEWLRWEQNDNSGVFVRFPDPTSKNYQNQAYVGVDFGFEVQIDEFGWPDQLDKHKTGAIYNADGQTLTQRAAHPPGQWNQFEILVQGQRYTVKLNGSQVSVFDNADRNRGLPTPAYIGLQTHPASLGETANSGRAAFRKIQIQKL